MPKQHQFPYTLALGSLLLYVIIGYGISRHETVPLFFCYFSLFILYVLVVRTTKSMDDQEVSHWLFCALIFRAVLLFSTPELSDDVFRFIWDGRVLAAGQSPFTHVPAYYMEPGHALSGLDTSLFEKLNSKDRYSSYPPVCQLIYWLAVKLSPDSIHGSVVVMKNLLFLFEIGTMWILTKLIRHFNLARPSILIYALNPLVILEITGNLHFEGVMIFFLMVAIYLLAKKKMFPSVAAFALSICTKLIPLLFLPLLYHTLGWKKAVAYWLTTGMIVGILFLPLMNGEIVHGFSTSIGYYFQRFEFNASAYYLIREAGFLFFGFNIIQYAGPLLGLIATALILYIAFRKLKLPLSAGLSPAFFEAMLWCLLVYLLSTTILHPWYIITLLAISVFTNYRFALVWTGMIFLTYAGYTKDSFQENLLLVSFEYLAVISYLVYETLWAPRESHF